MADFTSHQRELIKRYYDRRDQIMLERLQSIVTELYLAESDGKKARLWKRAERAMTALKVPPRVVQHILTRQDPEVLARNLRDWIAKPPK